MKIGILGGSFDPPHLGHLSLANQILGKTKLEEIWLLPCYAHAFSKELTKVDHRCEMAKLISSKRLRVSDFEIRNKKTGFTIDTLNLMAKKFSGEHFYWIMGSDQIRLFPKYKDWQEIIKNHNLMIFPREKSTAEINKKIKKYFKLKRIPKNIIVLEAKDYKINLISSTAIRRRVKKKMNIDGFVTPEVKEYIAKHRLYK